MRSNLLRLIFVFLMAAAAPAAWAATIPVTTPVDEADGSCGDGDCSLRDAVATSASGDTIAIPAGHYVLTLGEISVDKDLTISGAGARTTVLDGNGVSRIFAIANFDMFSVAAVLSDLSLVNGFPATGDPVTNGPFGGAVAGGSNSPGFLTVLRCGLQGNTAASGGAIYWQGPLSVVESTVEDNHATGTFDTNGGGGIYVLLGSPVLVNSTVSGNTSIGQGGGVAVIGGGLTLQNATITANQAGPGNGGGLALLILSSEAFLTNSIVAGNSGGDCLFSGNAAVADHSLDSDGSCGLASDPGSLPGVNPLLGPLANNGGPTDTHALLAGSPAIDAGDNATCLPTDQRGVARPQGPACDIGAFEVQVLTPQDQIAALIAQIQALVIGGTLAQNNANPLITKLESVSDKLDAGQVGAACNQLGAFINQLNAYISNGTLTPAQGQPLIDAAEAIQADLGC